MEGSVVMIAGGAGFVVLLVWLLVLTAVVVRRDARRGEPVYRRLPDGRTRFTWHVAQGHGHAERATADVDLRSRPPSSSS